LKQIILKELAEFQQMEAPSDDITLVLVKCALEEIRPERMRESKILKTTPFRYRADTTYLADVSRQVTTACRALKGLPLDSKGDDFVYLVELAVSEICTNIIKHAYKETSGDISGQIVLTNLGIQIDIYDQGNSFDPNAVPPPISDPTDPAEGGYGLHIVRQIMDIAEYKAGTRQGNHWKLVKYLPT
jgi:anti-sigma regulatory factor (Ser/Thr protein kinase)